MIPFIIGGASGGGYGQAIEIFAAVITVIGGSGITALVRADRKRAGIQAVRDFQFASLIDPKTGVMVRLDRIEDATDDISRKVTESNQNIDRHNRKLTEHINTCEKAHEATLKVQREIWAEIEKKQDRPK